MLPFVRAAVRDFRDFPEFLATLGDDISPTDCDPNSGSCFFNTSDDPDTAAEKQPNSSSSESLRSAVSFSPCRRRNPKEAQDPNNYDTAATFRTSVGCGCPCRRRKVVKTA